MEFLIFAFFGMAFLVAVLLIGTSIKTVPEHQRLVIFRLGRPLENPLGPGLVFVIPIIDRTVKVDLREQVCKIPNLSAVTRDSRPVNFSVSWKYQIIDPVKSVMAVGNYETAANGLVKAAMEALVKDIDFSEWLQNTESLRSTAATRLETATERWGLKTTGFEILKNNG